jgi:hypothetical protein
MYRFIGNMYAMTYHRLHALVQAAHCLTHGTVCIRESNKQAVASIYHACWRVRQECSSRGFLWRSSCLLA